MSNLDFLDEIARYLVTQGIGTAGTNIFVNELPDTPANCVAIFGLVGTTVQQQRDVPGLQFPRFQVVVRNTDYNDAADKFQAVRTALHGKVGLILPVGVNTATSPYIRVMRCHIETDGGPIGKDETGRVEFSCNFTAEYHHYAPA